MSQVDDSGNTYGRRNLLYGAVSLAACSLLIECGFTAKSAVNATPEPIPANPVPPAAATLRVTTNVLGTIPARFVGLSYEKAAMTYSYFRASNRHLIALFRLLGTGVLRIGGGSVDEVVYLPDGAGSHLQITPAEISDLAEFLNQTGWQCIYGVGFAASTPELAAQEAAYAMSALGSNLLGIEIGNEPDEYSIAGLFFVGDWTLADFVTRWELFRAAILQSAPNAPLTGPAAGGGNHITSWTLPFGQATGPGQITLLTQHYYRLSGDSPLATAAFLISPDSQLAGDLALLKAGALALGLPYRLDECNSFYSGGSPGVSNSYASSLWVLDFLFTVAANNGAGVNMHGGGNQPGYTPIADDSGGVIETRPEYYGLLFFTLAGSGTLLESTLETDGVDATAYAVKTASGGLNLVIVNKDLANGFPLTIMSNQSIQQATLQVMTGPTLSATSGVTIQGATVAPDGTFAPSPPIALSFTGKQATCYVPPLSAALINII